MAEKKEKYTIYGATPGPRSRPQSPIGSAHEAVNLLAASDPISAQAAE